MHAAWMFILEYSQTAMSQKPDKFTGGRIFGPALNWLVGISGLSRLLLWLIFHSKIRLPDKVPTRWLLGLANRAQAPSGHTHQIERKGTANAKQPLGLGCPKGCSPISDG
jgi:hypothetical protein